MGTPVRITQVLIACALALGGFVRPAGADTEANKETLRRVLEEAWNQGQFDVVDEVVAPAYMYRDPAMGDIPGPEGLKQAMTAYRTALPDLHFTVEEMVAEGDLVAMRWSATGTQEGELIGIPATGLATVTTGINIIRFGADGMMVEEWSNWDQLGLMQQLGVVEPPRPGDAPYTWTEPSDLTGDAGTPEENKLLALRVKSQFWNGKDIAGLDATHHPTAFGNNPAIPGPSTYESYRESCIMYQTVFPDLHVTIDDIIAEGDKVATRWTFTGTQRSELMGIPASDRHVTYRGATIYRMADGKVAETWWAYDALGMVQQLTAAQEWTAEGTWIVTVPSPMGAITMVHAIYPLDSSGTRYGGVLWQVNANPTNFGMFPDFTGGGQFWATESQRVAPNTYETSMVVYSTKSGEGPVESLASIGLANATWTITGPDTNEGQSTLATYLVAQDVDGDGLPDDGQEPTVCMPFEFTSKRVTSVPACVPTVTE